MSPQLSPEVGLSYVIHREIQSVDRKPFFPQICLPFTLMSANGRAGGRSCKGEHANASGVRPRITNLDYPQLHPKSERDTKTRETEVVYTETLRETARSCFRLNFAPSVR